MPLSTDDPRLQEHFRGVRPMVRSVPGWGVPGWRNQDLPCWKIHYKRLGLGASNKRLLYSRWLDLDPCCWAQPFAAKGGLVDFVVKSHLLFVGWYFVIPPCRDAAAGSRSAFSSSPRLIAGVEAKRSHWATVWETDVILWPSECHGDTCLCVCFISI